MTWHDKSEPQEMSVQAYLAQVRVSLETASKPFNSLDILDGVTRGELVAQGEAMADMLECCLEALQNIKIFNLDAGVMMQIEARDSLSKVSAMVPK